MGKTRKVITPFDVEQLQTDPPAPTAFELIDQLTHVLAALTGQRGLRRRLLRVDTLDRLKVVVQGKDANRISSTDINPIGAGVTVNMHADMVAWTIWAIDGAVQVFVNAPGPVSMGDFWVNTGGIWEMHMPCASVTVTASGITGAPATHAVVNEWRLT